MEFPSKFNQNPDALFKYGIRYIEKNNTPKHNTDGWGNKLVTPAEHDWRRGTQPPFISVPL
jgi:hypothetical protein